MPQQAQPQQQQAFSNPFVQQRAVGQAPLAMYQQGGQRVPTMNDYLSGGPTANFNPYQQSPMVAQQQYAPRNPLSNPSYAAVKLFRPKGQ
jgi:hypothetical protein